MIKFGGCYIPNEIYSWSDMLLVFYGVKSVHSFEIIKLYFNILLKSYVHSSNPDSYLLSSQNNSFNTLIFC